MRRISTSLALLTLGLLVAGCSDEVPLSANVDTYKGENGFVVNGGLYSNQRVDCPVGVMDFTDALGNQRAIRLGGAVINKRELEVMHVFWKRGEQTAWEARDRLAEQGIDRAYVTVANLVRILVEKGFLEQTNNERPFQYRPVRAFRDVSRNLVRDLMQRVFLGSREELLVQVLSQKKLTAKERAVLEQILKEQEP